MLAVLVAGRTSRGLLMKQSGVECCNMRGMSKAERVVRQSVSLPRRVAGRVRVIARRRKTSTNKVLVDLVETGLETKEAERKRVFDLARRYKECSDPVESDRLGEELVRLIFGE